MSSLKERIEERQKVEHKDTPKGYSFTGEEGDVTLPTKVLLYGHSGTGKTYFLIGLLLTGERIIVLSTDFGDNGLLTVVNELKKLGKTHLLKNLRGIDLNEYKDVLNFLKDPKGFDFLSDVEEFDPTVLVWEGFSFYNLGIVDQHVMSFEPGAEKSGELRYEGLTHTQQDWQGTKRGTITGLSKFFSFTINGKKIHKVLTCLEAQPKLDDLTNQSLRSVLIHGTGRSLMGPGFDVVIETAKEENKGEIKYFYRCNGSSEKFLVKSRGFDLKPIEAAEPERVWRILRGEKV